MSNNKPCYPNYVRGINGDTGFGGRKLKDNKDIELKLSKFFGENPKYKICEDCGSPSPPSPSSLSDEWVRPAQWLELPTPASGSQEFYGLFPVWETSNNFVALYVDGTENYQVDWGDGNVETVTAGTKAQHAYSFSDLNASTFVDIGKFRQAVVKVSMLNNGDMTEFDLRYLHDNLVGPYTIDIPWLDININGPNLTLLGISFNNSMEACSLERAGLYELNSLTSADSLFEDAISLQKLEITGFQNVTSTVEMFYACRSLKSVPLFDTSSVTDMEGMFRSCYSLKNLPLFNTSNVTNLNEFAYLDYSSLNSIPLLDTSNATDMGYFIYQSILQYIPTFNTSNTTTTADRFTQYNMHYIDAMDYSNIEDNINLYYVSAFKPTGFTRSLYIKNTCDFNKTHLVEILNNLGTASPGAVVTIECPSASTLSPAEIQIATDKGFTVTI